MNNNNAEKHEENGAKYFQTQKHKKSFLGTLLELNKDTENNEKKPNRFCRMLAFVCGTSQFKNKSTLQNYQAHLDGVQGLAQTNTEKRILLTTTAILVCICIFLFLFFSLYTPLEW